MAEPLNLEQSLGAKVRTGQLPSEFDLGVLIVHGIGEQQRGDTLTETADAVVEWLRRRVEERGEGSVELLDVALRLPGEDDVSPAHLALRLRARKADGGEVTVRWLIAESWWAEAFRASSFTDLALWGVTAAPWVVSTHVTSLAERMAFPGDIQPWRKWLLAPIAMLVVAVWTVTATVVALFTAVLAVFLILFRLIPLPFVPDIAAAVSRTMAGGLGDAYVLVRSPVRLGAMASQVRADLATLSKRSTSVAVIAHSQGSAVAWEAIRSSRPSDHLLPPNLHLLVTYGQALRKLQFLRQIHRRAPDGRDFVAIGMILAIIAGALELALLVPFAAGPFIAWFRTAHSEFPRDAVGVLAVLASTICGQLYLLLRSNAIDSEAKLVLERQVRTAVQGRSDFVWHDLWASADPMPNGPINLTNRVIVSTKLRNSASAILDHVTYWQNLAEFLPLVAARIKTIGGLGAAIAPDSIESPILKLAAMRRQARVLLLVAARVSVVILTAAWLISWWEEWKPIGDTVIDAIAKLPVLELIPDEADRPTWLGHVVGIGVGLGAATTIWQLFLVVWKGAIATDDRAMLGTVGAQGSWNRPMWTRSWQWMVVLIAFLVGGGISLVAIGNVFVAFGAWTAMAVAVPLAVTLIGSGGQRWGQRTAPTSITALGNAAMVAGSLATLAIGVIAVLVALILDRTWVPWVLATELWLIAGTLLLEVGLEYVAFRRLFESLRRQPSGHASSESIDDERLLFERRIGRGHLRIWLEPYAAGIAMVSMESGPEVLRDYGAEECQTVVHISGDALPTVADELRKDRGAADLPGDAMDLLAERFSDNPAAVAHLRAWLHLHGIRSNCTRNAEPCGVARVATGAPRTSSQPRGMFAARDRD